jgi:hypothetical protein
MVASPFSLCLTSLAYWAGEGVACFIRRAAPVAYLCVLLGRLPCRVQRSYHVPRQSKGTAGCHFVWPLVRTRALRKYNLQAGSHSDFFPMQTRTWKVWENETSSLTYEFVNGNPIFLTCNFLCRPRFSVFFTFTVKLDPSKFRLTRQTSFVRQHASCWNKSTILLYIVCFHGIITSCHCTEY